MRETDWQLCADLYESVLSRYPSSHFIRPHKVARLDEPIGVHLSTKEQELAERDGVRLL